MFLGAGRANGGEAVNISATDHTFTKGCQALWIGTTGDVKFDTADGTALTIANVPVGLLDGIVMTKVYKVGTTASDLVGFF